MTRVRSGLVNVEGLRELSRSLDELGPDLKREVRQANKEAATFVADKAGSRARSLGSTAAHAAPSIKASAGYTSAGVGFGGAAHPEAPGAEFGGQRRPTTQQFEPWRGNGSRAGYFVYPTIREETEKILEPYEEALDRVARKAFPQ